MAAVLRRKLQILPTLLPRIRPFSALPEPECELAHSSPDPVNSTKTSSSEPRALHPLLQLQLSIRSEPDPDRVAELFLSSKDLNRFHSSRPLYSLTVRKLSRAQRPDLVKKVLDPLLTDPNTPKSDGYLSRLLSLYSSAGLPDAAMEAFCRATPDNRGERSFNALLQAFIRNGRYADLKSTFEKASSEFNFTPGLFSYNILVNGLCENGELDEARKLLDEMSKGDNNLPEPCIITYNTILCGCVKKGKEESFDEILNEIYEKGLEPNVVTYNCRIARFCNKGESFKGEEILDVMDTKNIKPTISTFYNLIHGYCKEGNVSAAMKMFRRMKVAKRRSGSDGVSPNSDIYNVLIKSLNEKESFDDALFICKDSLHRSKLPPFEDVKGIINGLLKESKIDEAKDLNESLRLLLKDEAKEAWEKMIKGVSFEGSVSSNE